MAHNPQSAPPPAASICATCGHSGSDVRIKSCINGCSYHARCLDVMAILARHNQTPLFTPSSNNIAAAHHQVVASEHAKLTSCPCCASPATGLEMIPLSFTEIDHSQRLSGYNKSSSSSGGGSSGAQSSKRMHIELLNDSSTSQHSSSSFYDPTSPRTGKWSDEEIAFRDTLVPHFVDGSLPLPSGLKLIEFLSSMLKSKPSRLTKKMKHAKLSTRHFHLNDGCIRSLERAKDVSRLEMAFVNSISDPVERSEIKFHMQREWRDHLAERLTYLRISFDAEEWLKSVDMMDRRITLAKSRNRMVKRRFMMGKAMEKDTSSPTPGIFIDNSTENIIQDVDFELLASALETNDSEDADLRDLLSGMAADGNANTTTAPTMGSAQEVSVDGSNSRPSSADPSPFRSALLPSLGSAEGPNFRFAAPFLAKITAYIEHNRMPFEHVDIWVPSSSDGHPVLDPTGATAPEPSVLGSGSNTKVTSGGVQQTGTGRLCFAGSASVGVQIMTDAESEESPLLGTPSPSFATFDHRSKPGLKAVPLSSDEIYHLSLFGSYSEKFSFSSGCGLPGRVFESAVPAWEQFIANAPSHLFERRGGAMQFGIKTALGLPIKSPNVGRIVMVLYSKHNREKDDDLVAQMVRDFQSLNPCPRWKLMVDMGSNDTVHQDGEEQQQVAAVVPMSNVNQQPGGLTAAMAGLSEKNIQISNLISLLGENMPSDPSTLLGQQLHNIMSLRLVLLRTNRNPEEEQVVDSILTLFDSYVKAGRSRPDITLMLARDFAFHSIQHHQQQQQQQPPMQLNHQSRQVSFPTMQHLSIGASVIQQQQQQQEQPSCQLDHTHHGQSQPHSFPESVSCTNNPIFQEISPNQTTGMSSNQSVAAMTMNASQSMTSMNSRGQSSASFSSLTEVRQISPRSAASLSCFEGNHQVHSLIDPPASLPS
mmetsp:Transcript_5235/g.11874  ORF Transcript_5235/g.11874 Transcript_5235/m.11874 type:complete len:931 (-) Transcript_5235:262-3054(-)|eukprot:CAMPEP_0172313558 /NCGR_PEP_ID=MMETSP1058-20130122/20441_1 /TAXON_ID=83371 /ORGANISM="Detonula confervacea, Strain CCMP 353" /LENGTH=930 /DNA_ID=CAMNT_0013027221 /DNA_START=19 /DNA_END=2811 /DNA_ORIENTATION=-